jgi:hypothetical protein
MFQRIFEKLEHDGDDGGEPPVTEDEGIAPGENFLNQSWP